MQFNGLEFMLKEHSSALLHFLHHVNIDALWKTNVYKIFLCTCPTEPDDSKEITISFEQMPVTAAVLHTMVLQRKHLFIPNLILMLYVFMGVISISNNDKCLTRLTRQVPLMEQELLTLLEYLITWLHPRSLEGFVLLDL